MGSASVVTTGSPFLGTHAAMVGAPTPTYDSELSQTFTLPSSVDAFCGGTITGTTGPTGSMSEDVDGCDYTQSTTQTYGAFTNFATRLHDCGGTGSYSGNCTSGVLAYNPTMQLEVTGVYNGASFDCFTTCGMTPTLTGSLAPNDTGTLNGTISQASTAALPSWETWDRCTAPVGTALTSTFSRYQLVSFPTRYIPPDPCYPAPVP
jgi:hypothetical protein